MDCSPIGSMFMFMDFSGQEYWSGLPFPSVFHLRCFVFSQPSYGRLLYYSVEESGKALTQQKDSKIRFQCLFVCLFFIKLGDTKSGDIFFKSREKMILRMGSIYESCMRRYLEA